jgi:histidyl-tRNA synthetase
MPAAQPIRASRGVRDILPEQWNGPWRRVSTSAATIAERFGYQPIETPIIEPAELVERGVGDTTDIVTKEMFCFQDRGERWLVLRPEGTAGTVRAYFEGNLNQGPQPARLYTIGPMFRAERPQAGRYRQFYQFNVEAIGGPSPALDAEVIEIATGWLAGLGLAGVTLELNSVGDAKCRPSYREALLAYYRPLRDQLCPDCQARLELNPLRLLDCKEDQRFVAGAPKITDHLCEECAAAFADVRRLLDAAGIEYRVNPLIVRGLDYYTRTAFELHHQAIGGAQNALGGGGRYDGLAEELGWPPTPGVGFAAGIDRVVSMLGEEAIEVVAPPAADVAVVPDGDQPDAAAAVGRLCRTARSTWVDYSSRSLRAKMRSVDRLGARWAAIFNAEEAARRVVQLRDLDSGDQGEIGWDALPAALAGVK